MKIRTGYYSAMGLALMTLTCTANNAMAFPGFGTNIDNACADLGYPLLPEFQPQVSGDCFACHDNGASGGSGAGRSAYPDAEFFCPPVAMNEPPVAQANGPYNGETGQAISFSSAGSMDPDGSIASYFWEFGDGQSSMDANPAHTYTAAGDYSVNLTVMDDAGDTDTSSTSASITPPPVNEPDINLTSAELDFGMVEVNTSATLTTVVENTGNQPLEVTSIIPCSETSIEYSWSPSSFTVAEGASQTVSVMYSPTDENTDSGCLDIASNDPDENPATVNLTGTGFVPLPQMLDLDIAGFRTNKRVSLRRVKAIAPQLVVRNTGTIDGTASATLTGTQNGSVVYSEEMALNVGIGQRARVKFPRFTPTETGTIEWHVTVIDEDPDVDEATASTRVVR